MSGEELTAASLAPSFVAFDDAVSGRVLVYRDPVCVLRADEPREVPGILHAMEAAISAGHHLAGYATYELGGAFEEKLAALLTSRSTAPLLWFGVFAAAPTVLDGPAADAFWIERHWHATPLATEWSRADYADAFRSVQELIAAGDIFQANLTFRARFSLQGDPLGLFRDLRAHGGSRYGAFIDDGDRTVLSVSPELFFETSPSGRIEVAPMKGTAPRGRDQAEDELARRSLATSEKDRAENLMIVDLMRNDLGRVALLGSVAVAELFTVETYPTLHTLVSRISARLQAERSPETILRALFPCGSVTGAPKIRAMEIIAATETSPRGLYCGAIGQFRPDGSASFNVAIRTMTVVDGCGELGIGGAVTADSASDAEWSEALLKARYFERARRPVTLIETLRLEHGVLVRLERHLDRMAASACAFGLIFDRDAARRALDPVVAGRTGVLRVRLVLAENGEFSTTASLLERSAAQWTCTVSPARVDSGDIFLRHKTDRRQLYDQEHARQASRYGADETLFLNEREELCEGSRTNLFLELDGRLLTSALSAGLLPGCLRAELLHEGKAFEAVLRLSDLARATRLLVGNSLRGLKPTRILSDRGSAED